MLSFPARRQRVDNTEPVVSTLILSPVDSLVFLAVKFQDVFPQVLYVMAVSGNYMGQEIWYVICFKSTR